MTVTGAECGICKTVYGFSGGHSPAHAVLHATVKVKPRVMGVG